MKKTIAWLFVATLFFTHLRICAQNDTVPFLYRYHLFVNATINDTVNSNVVFDTGGADLFGVDSVWLNQSGWVPLNFGVAKAGGGAGAMLIPIILDKTKVKIGNIKENYDMVPVFKLRDVVDCHVDGILGIKSIETYPFEINFEHEVFVQHKAGMPTTEGFVRIPIKYEDNRILLQLETRLGGATIKGWYLMDTGSGGSVEFTAQSAKQFRLDTISGKRYNIDYSQFGLGDKKQEYIVEMLSEQIVIGQDTMFRYPISYIPEGTGAFGNASYLAVIGNHIWSNYNMIIDVKNQVLYLRRYKDFPSPKPTYDYSFRNRTDISKGWIVSSLVRDGDAVRTGMALGDTVISINGRNVTDYSWDEEYRINDNPQHVMNIVGVDGREKHITLEAKMQW